MKSETIVASALASDQLRLERPFSNRRVSLNSDKRIGAIGMTRHRGLLCVPLAAVVALILVAGAPVGWAGADEIPYDEAEIFFELNNTDGDLGIHALIDGEAWKTLKIMDPKNHNMLDIEVKERLREQGLTEIFFESAEPRFDELSPEEFFDRFPEGEYEIEGETLEGEELESETQVTHTMPAPPVPTVNGESMAVQCDDEEPGFDASEVNAPVTIAWDEVTRSHPDLGTDPAIEVEIHNYEVVVEVELDVDGEEFESVLHVVLPPGVREMRIPAQFIALGEEFKYEVLAREESFNQTAVESCFVLVRSSHTPLEPAH